MSLNWQSPLGVGMVLDLMGSTRSTCPKRSPNGMYPPIPLGGGWSMNAPPTVHEYAWTDLSPACICATTRGARPSPARCTCETFVLPSNVLHIQRFPSGLTTNPLG